MRLSTPFRRSLALVLPILGVAGGITAASAAPLTVKPITATRKDLGAIGRYRFPEVSGGAAASAINTWLQVNELNRFPGAAGRQAPFDAVWPHKGDAHGVVGLDYSVDANTPGYLSLTVTGEYDGAYPSPFSNSYQFDARSGRPLTLADLFSGAGMKTFQARLREARLKLLDKTLAEPLDKDLPADDAEAQRDAYRMCRKMVGQDDAELSRDTLTDSALTVTWSCEFPHAIQALDDLGPQTESFTFGSLAPLLSDYGTCLLIQHGSDCSPPPGAAGVYHGRLGGRYAITLMIGGQWSDAAYAYDRIGTPIELTREDGTAAKHWVLTHRADGDKTETFDLTLDHGRLAGTWRRAGGKALPVRLSAEPVSGP